MTIPALVFTQFLSEQIALVLGKLDTTIGDSNAFAQWSGTERFLNMAFIFNPVIARTIPYSPLGAAILVLPAKNVVFNISVLDTDGVPTRSGFDTMFDGHTTYSSELTIKTNFWNLPGHQLFGGTFASGEFVALDLDLLSLVPNSGVPLKRSDDSWCFYYNFYQYFWTLPEEPTRGIGVFGRFGVADEATNPIEQFYSIGLGGNGMFSSRPFDRFGVGYYYMKTSGDLPDLLSLGDKKGVEMFYNFAVIAQG